MKVSWFLQTLKQLQIMKKQQKKIDCPTWRASKLSPSVGSRERCRFRYCLFSLLSRYSRQAMFSNAARRAKLLIGSTDQGPSCISFDDAKVSILACTQRCHYRYSLLFAVNLSKVFFFSYFSLWIQAESLTYIILWNC